MDKRAKTISQENGKTIKEDFLMKPLARNKKICNSIDHTNCSGLSGDCSGLRGNCSRLSGNCSGLSGNCSEIPTKERPCKINDWVEEVLGDGE